MDKNKENIQDKDLRDLFSETKLTASENLKYRIMQQIATEQSLVGKKRIKLSPFVGKILLSTLGAMYIVIIALGLLVYSEAGKEGIESTIFSLCITLIVSVCMTFLAISVFDEQRREKQSESK